ncbi:hypothetical protein D3C75_1163350 [compost metagenome]
MDGLELGGRQEAGGVALVGLDLVGQAQLFEQPDDALGAGLVQVVQDYHGNLDGWHKRLIRAGVVTGSPAGKKERADARSVLTQASSA